MNPILLDFEKLFATIEHPNNTFMHLDTIKNMINVFERKYKSDFSTSTKLLVDYAKIKFERKKIELNGGA